MPAKMDSGFVKADSGNLPKIFMFMVLEYSTSNSKYAAPQKSVVSKLFWK